jgi:hypothetical protein
MNPQGISYFSNNYKFKSSGEAGPGILFDIDPRCIGT